MRRSATTSAVTGYENYSNRPEKYTSRRVSTSWARICVWRFDSSLFKKVLFEVKFGRADAAGVAGGESRKLHKSTCKVHQSTRLDELDI